MTLEDQALVLTPSARAFLRKSIIWVAIVSIMLAIAAVGIAISSSSDASAQALGPATAAPEGSMALVEVLRQQGVEVTATASLVDTKAAVDDPAETSILVYDETNFLTSAQVEELLLLADSIVLVAPSFETLDAAAPSIALAGFVDETLTADCELTAVEKAGTVSGSGWGYRVVDDETDAIACLGSDDDVYSLIQVERGPGTTTVLGAVDALQNGTILEEGNAALALNLLGSKPSLIWYLPSAADLEPSETLAQLAPGWVVPVTLVSLLTIVFAAVWRGRRMGPLIAENLPVTVPASETMRGRARLYEHASARGHTLDSLRIGTIARLAHQVGLPTLASIDEVIVGVAAVTGKSELEVARLLVDLEPFTDRELVRLSDELLTLEKLVARRVRPG